MEDLLNTPVADVVFCLARAMVLGILVSSEALLARHRRVGFEHHLILFSAFALLMAAEVLGFSLGLYGSLWHGAEDWRWLWVWYPVVTTVGLLSMAFAFDYMRITHTVPPGPLADRTVRRSGRRFLMGAGLLLALGAVLSGMDLHGSGPSTSIGHLGRAAYLLHGAQALALLILARKALITYDIWLSPTENRVFLLGCLTGLIGAGLQLYLGSHEPLTPVAFTLFVAVFLRDNYRRSEVEAAQAMENRTARTLLFHRITTQLKSTSELPRLYEITMDSLLSNLGAESGAIYVLDPHDKALQPALLHGPYPPPLPMSDADAGSPEEVREMLAHTPVPMEAGIVGHVAATNRPLYADSPAAAAHYYTWSTGSVQVRTTIALPLRSPEGCYGVIQVVNRLDGNPFAEEDLRFMSLITEQAGLAIYNARLHGEMLQRQRSEEQLKVAREIQLRLIPRELPRIPGISLAAEYQAALEVGGDYFDFYRIDHDHLGVVIFDVAGKGVPGALLMAITGTFLKMATPRSNSPAWVLNEVNAALSAEMSRGMFVTAIYGVLRMSTLQLTLVNAGHPDAIVIRERDLSCERHKPRGAALGLLRPNRFRTVMEQETIQLEEGDTLLFYTDGVIEAVNDQQEEFGIDRLCAVARQFAREGPHRLSAEIKAAVMRHAGAQPQYDDITVVALRIAPEPEDAPPAPGAAIRPSPEDK